MPLSAVIDGLMVCGPLLDERAWRQLRGSAITLACGHPGFARTSPLGTRHFVHMRDSGCGHSESGEHLHLKAVVARAVAGAGWSACTEAVGPGYVADVLAAKGSARVALEVQRSRQVLRDYERRQARYADDGIRCVWLVKHVPAGHQAGPDLPMFRITDWQEQPVAVVSGRAVPVAELVPALLSGDCRWRAQVRSDRTVTEWMHLLCPMCGRRRRVPTARWSAGRCGCGLPVLRLGHATLLPERDKCCGYWGEGFAVERSTSGARVRTDVDCGHWCLSA